MTAKANTANEKLVEEVSKAYARKDIEAVISHLAEDCLLDDIPAGGSCKGPHAKHRQFLAKQLEPIASVAIEPVRYYSLGDVVVTERIMTAVTKAGKRAATPTLGIFEFKGGKIVMWRGYYNMLTFLQQTGEVVNSGAEK